MQLSKSSYMNYLRHPALLWLEKHDKDKLPAHDDATLTMFDNGRKFEVYAESLFKDGVALGFTPGVFGEYASLTDRTRNALAGGATTIFQSRFEAGDYTCLPDVIKVVADGVVDVYEIKSSTRVKEEHLYDLAFQRAVIEAGSHYKVRNCYVIFVNNQYVRAGEIKPEELTKIEDVSYAVRELESFTAVTMPLALDVLKSAAMPDPHPSFLGKFGNKKEWQAIYDSLTGKEKPSFEGALPSINTTAIRHFLSGLTFPLYFLDYETMSAVVPYFNGHRPYQQIPTQYSLHILDSPDAELRHREYLHIENSDPAAPLAEQLLKDIGASGSVVTWNMSFEKACNVTLAGLNPALSDELLALNERVIDLIVPFKPKNGWYSDDRFEGSASIKKVLPVVVPELSYKELGIQNGGTAQSLWMQAVLDGARADKEQILADLLKYCELDTLAMVEIYRKLRFVAGDTA